MKIFRKLILIILILGMIYVLRDIYKEDNIRLVDSSMENIYKNDFFNITSNSINNMRKEKSFYYNEVYVENNENKNDDYYIPEKHLGYKVDGILEIPKIGLKTYVFKEYSENAMNICPTKLWGPKPNSNGNYSIIGHNYQKENMFNNLIDLGLGDEIFLIDSDNGKNKYIVYDIYKVKENNVEPIKQNSKNNIELTLITCVNYTNNRLIIKAQHEV